MVKKQIEKEVKAPKTVQVKTLFKVAGLTVAIVLVFIAGWFSNTAFNQYDQSRVKNEAKVLVKQLNSQK